ncbi:MAG TPA: glutamate--tRNA ligase, partial [Spirochaetales bacterium]|nr:glutamate--tRNA ligase [Spirochaetales bacterium]
LVTPFLADAGLVSTTPSASESAIVLSAMALVRERLKYLSDAPEALAFLFAEPAVPPAADMIPKKLDAARTVTCLQACSQLLHTVDVHSHEEAEAAFRSKADELGCKLGDLLMPLRMAVTGTKVSPPLFESIAVLGVNKAFPRIERAIAVLKESV